jgi:hypothetical protein
VHDRKKGYAFCRMSRGDCAIPAVGLAVSKGGVRPANEEGRPRRSQPDGRAIALAYSRAINQAFRRWDADIGTRFLTRGLAMAARAT